MSKRHAAIAALSAAMLFSAHPGAAATISDPAKDFLPTYLGPPDADLDVVSFGVQYDPIATAFMLSATLAGTIDTTKLGFYVIGVNTGTPTPTGNFASINAPGVVFTQTIVIQKTGAATIAGAALPAGSVAINGSSFTAIVPLSRLPGTGFAPVDYGFNLWPRTSVAGITGTAAISDFAPNNATLTAVPEPGTWAMLALGFGAVGAALRYGKPPGAPARFG